MEKKLKQLLKTIKLNESLLSMLFGIVTVVLIGVLVFRAYQAKKPTITAQSDQTQVATEKVGDVAVETKEDGQKYPTSLPDSVKVEKGQNLWKIAEANYGSGYNYVDIIKENKLANPSKLAVGQELKLPKVAVKVVVAKATVSPKVTVATTTITGDSYTVIKGDHLWGIAVRAYADGYQWTKIAQANHLKNPGRIVAGQKLTLPR